MGVVDQVALPLATRLLICLEQEILRLPEADRPKRIGLRTGDRVDFLVSTRQNECCLGLAWVRVASIAPSSTANWPSQDVVPPRCGVQQWAVVLEMGIVRCAPVPTVSAIPTVDTWNGVTEAVLADFAVMDRAICCFQDGFRRLTLPGQWQPLSIDGMCVGGTMELTAAASACNCGEDESPS